MTFKPILILVTLTLKVLTSKSQIPETVDSLTQEICKSFNENPTELDSLTVEKVMQKHLNKYVPKMPVALRNQAVEKVYIRLQSSCEKFHAYAMSFSQTKDWITVDKCPSSSLSNNDLKQFFKIKKYNYIEGNGDTTKLEISETKWRDVFKDGTYSELSLTKLSPSDFVIEFVASNNTVRKSMSKVGDKYYYSIVSKEKNYYLMCVSVPYFSKSTLFKVYY